MNTQPIVITPGSTIFLRPDQEYELQPHDPSTGAAKTTTVHYVPGFLEGKEPPLIRVHDGARLTAYGEVGILAHNAQVSSFNGAYVAATGESRVRAYGYGIIVAGNMSEVELHGDEFHVTARDMATVDAQNVSKGIKGIAVGTPTITVSSLRDDFIVTTPSVNIITVDDGGSVSEQPAQPEQTAPVAPGAAPAEPVSPAVSVDNVFTPGVSRDTATDVTTVIPVIEAAPTPTVIPVTPQQPVAPITPAVPQQPVAPITPAVPQQPAAPVTPTVPQQPAAPVEQQPAVSQPFIPGWSAPTPTPQAPTEAPTAPAAAPQAPTATPAAAPQAQAEQQPQDATESWRLEDTTEDYYSFGNHVLTKPTIDENAIFPDENGNFHEATTPTMGEETSQETSSGLDF